MRWKEPELPRPLKPVRKPAVDSRKKLGPRALAALAGIALGVTGAINLYGALSDTTGKQSPFGALAMLLPVIILFRYALTGQIRGN